MIDEDVRELRRLVQEDPVQRGLPDVAAIMGHGRRQRLRARVTTGALALGAVAVLAGPVVLAAGALQSGTQQDTRSYAQETTAAADFVWPEPDCGVVSCAGADATYQTEPVLAEVELGPMSGGGSDLLYVLEGDGFDAQEGQKVDVVATGYRRDGEIFRTSWAAHVNLAAERDGSLWFQEGRLNGRPADDDGWVMVGWVPGSPERITWQTPAGEQGEVQAVLRRDGYTAFAAVLPFPKGYEPPPRVLTDPDGTVTVETPDGVVEVPPHESESGSAVRELIGELPLFAPDATVTTSDGWSCSLDECGSSG